MVAKSKKKILVVEDEKTLAQIVKMKLESSQEYEVTNAYTGKEALDILSKQSFEVMLLDLVMPEMNGFMVLEEIKKRGLKTAVIVASNLGQNEDIKKALSLGAKDYYIKSEVSLTDIIDRIKKVI